MSPILVFAIAMALVAAGIVGAAEQGQKGSADAAHVATQYADVGLTMGEAAVLQDLSEQVQAIGPEGPFTSPAASAAQPACAATSLGACPYLLQIAVVYTGSVNGGGGANTTAENVNRAGTLRESPVYATITSTITDLHGVRMASDSETVTYRTQLKSPYVLPYAVNAPGSKADLAAEHDNGGCDPSNPNSCGSTWNGSPSQTMIDNFDQCVDDGNPADGLCGPATPRPDNDFQNLNLHSGNVGAFGS